MVRSIYWSFKKEVYGILLEVRMKEWEGNKSGRLKVLALLS